MQIKKMEKKQSIVEAAKELFVERGFENTSMADIAKCAKVGKGTIYTYFPSKDKLVYQVAWSVYESLNEDIKGALLGSKNGSEFVENLVSNIFKDIDTRGKLIYMVHRSKIDYQRAYEDFTKKYREILKKVHEKFFNDIDYDELFFILTSFIMSSYIMIKGIGYEKLKNILEKSLKKLLMNS